MVRVDMSKKTLRISKIKNGTVIDHITKGHALDVVKILGINGRSDGVITITMNVPSSKIGVKDVVKIEVNENLFSQITDRLIDFSLTRIIKQSLPDFIGNFILKIIGNILR